MKVEVTTIWPKTNNDEDLQESLNALDATRIIKVESHGDYEYRVIYEVED